MGGADGGVGGSWREQGIMAAEETGRRESLEGRVRRKSMTGWWTSAGRRIKVDNSYMSCFSRAQRAGGVRRAPHDMRITVG